MRTMHIPRLDLSPVEPVTTRIEQLLQSGVLAPIDQLNWPDAFPKSLPVTVSAAHDDERLFLCYSVTGEQLRAIHAKDFDPVWQDSCVEFFMQREGDAKYRNFECNALGALLAGYRESRESFEWLREEVSSITRYSIIQHRYDLSRQVTDWWLYLEIPKTVMGFEPNETLSGQKIRANFYKCGDETAEPHYLSWSPINLPAPDFHAPQFFGLLEMA